MKTTVQTPRPSVDDRSAREEYVSPEVNIFETGEGYVLEAEMPGVGKDGLEITVEENELTITGRRTAEPVTGELLFRERSTLNYRRAFELDPAVDPSRIAAKMEAGVLTLTLPKSERVKPRKIAVS